MDHITVMMVDLSFAENKGSHKISLAHVEECSNGNLISMSNGASSQNCLALEQCMSACFKSSSFA
jgi:hypothetical protein